MTIDRASKLFLPTLRDAPADAEAISHKLLVRAGYIRQLSAGLWTFTPLGWRVHRKVEQIIREEMAGDRRAGVVRSRADTRGVMGGDRPRHDPGDLPCRRTALAGSSCCR